MMHLRSRVLFLLFFLGGGRRSIQIDGSHRDSQQQNSMLTNSREVSADAREAFIPGGFGTGVLRRAGPQARVSRQGSRQASRRVGHLEANRVASWFRFGPHRAKDTLMAASGSKENPKKDERFITVCATPEGAALRASLGDPDFPAAWGMLVSSLADKTAGTADESSLEARIEQVRLRERRRRILADSLALAVERSFVAAQIEMLCDADAISPGQPLPAAASTLVRVSQQFPGQSARQVRAFVTEAIPSSDSEVVGRFDRLQAARLQMGCIQFGYFVSQIFRGPAAMGLEEEAVLAPREAQALQDTIQRATQEMKTEAAWTVASRRAGLFFALQRDKESPDSIQEDALGYEALRRFSVGVQVVAAAQQEEFFAAAPQETAQPRETAEAAPGALPTGEFVRFNAAGLQALLGEACLFGWHLWGAETAAIEALEGRGEDAAALLQPPKARVSTP